MFFFNRILFLTNKNLFCCFSIQFYKYIFNCFFSSFTVSINDSVYSHCFNPTCQLVKNTFLKNERTLSRKMVEMVMSLALEKTMLKGQILSCYMSKVKYTHLSHH